MGGPQARWRQRQGQAGRHSWFKDMGRDLI